MKKTTEYKHVSWSIRKRKWIAVITHNKIRYECGDYDDEISAVKAVDKRIIALGLNYNKLQIIKPVNNARPNP